MTWVKLDDQFPDHPKVVEAGPLAAWLHVCAIAYCNRQLTDGFIPESIAYRLADYKGIGIETGGDGETYAVGDDADCEWMASILCKVGLWKRVKGGFLIHDYLDYQPSKEQVLKEREKARERMANRRRSGDNPSNGSSEHPANFGRTSEEVHGPRPDPSRAEQKKDVSPQQTPPTSREDGLLIGTEILLLRLLDAIGKHADDKTADTIRNLHPTEHALVVATERTRQSRARNRAGYAVNVIKSEMSGVAA